ncbi:MAG TPA: LptE family protein [Chitinispirillaceae bacterium]|nr:LptE family protein [Chitinispirillaceae bacterium]
MRKTLLIIGVFVLFLFNGCGIYTFSGSTLPSYLKTVDIPLFINESMEPDVADEITQLFNQQMLSYNMLRIVSERGDATITGTVTSYSNTPYTFGASAAKQVDVEQYMVSITANVQFIDNQKSKPLFEGSVTGEGIYDFKTETEETGRTKAVNDLVQRALQNTIQSW